MAEEEEGGRGGEKPRQQKGKREKNNIVVSALETEIRRINNTGNIFILFPCTFTFEDLTWREQRSERQRNKHRSSRDWSYLLLPLFLTVGASQQYRWILFSFVFLVTTPSWNSLHL